MYICMYLHIFVACQTTKPSSRNNVVSMFADSAEKRQHALRNGDVEHRQAHCSVATLLSVEVIVVHHREALQVLAE